MLAFRRKRSLLWSNELQDDELDENQLLVSELPSEQPLPELI